MVKSVSHVIQIFGGSTRKLEMIHITNYTSAYKRVLRYLNPSGCLIFGLFSKNITKVILSCCEGIISDPICVHLDYTVCNVK